MIMIFLFHSWGIYVRFFSKVHIFILHICRPLPVSIYRPYQQFFHDTEVADSLRVVVDAMRLQSGKKDEKPEEVDISMMKSYPV